MAESQESFGFDMDFDIDWDVIFDSELESEDELSSGDEGTEVVLNLIGIHY